MMLANQSKIHWPRLLSGLLVTTVCALSVHAVMLQVLNVPFPVMSVVPSTFRFLGKTVVTLGLIIFLQLASRLLEGSVLKQWGVLALISAMLTETLFRGPFMDGYCTSAFTFAFVSNGPHLLTMALLCGIVATVARWLPSGWQKMLASVAITALMMFLVTPLVNVATAPLMKAIAGLAPQGEWCSLPYGPKVLIPAYLSFAEPVLACLAAAALVWNQLAVPRTMRFLQFILIILAIKNQLVSPFIYAAFAKGGFLHGLESEGQFALEALVLAALIGATWEWSVQPRPDVLPQGSRQEI